MAGRVNENSSHENKLYSHINCLDLKKNLFLKSFSGLIIMFEIVHQLTNCGTTALITQYNLEPFVPGHVSLPAGGFCIIDQAFKK